jgi:hypothetical protein
LVDQLNIIDEQWAYSEYHLAKAYSDLNTENAMLLLARMQLKQEDEKYASTENTEY